MENPFTPTILAASSKFLPSCSPYSCIYSFLLATLCPREARKGRGVIGRAVRSEVAFMATSGQGPMAQIGTEEMQAEIIGSQKGNMWRL